MDKKAESVIETLKKQYPDSKHYLNFSNPLQLMVASILSAQVRDEVVNGRTPLLFRKYKTAKDYAKANLAELENKIKSITFYRNKAKNIQSACKILEEKFNGQVPKRMEDLISLPGIARKTANAIQQNAFGIVEGVVVDTHVIRLSQRLGWTKEKYPKKIEKDLMELFDKKHWKEIPHFLKSHGRKVCRAPMPFCSQCIVNKLCPKVGVQKSS